MLERQAIDRGAILFDPQRVRAPGPELFEPEYLRARGRLSEEAGGRGTVRYFDGDGVQLGPAALPARRDGGAIRARPLPLAGRGAYALVPRAAAARGAPAPRAAGPAARRGALPARLRGLPRRAHDRAACPASSRSPRRWRPGAWMTLAGRPSAGACAASTTPACSTRTSTPTTSCWTVTAGSGCSTSTAAASGSPAPGASACSNRLARSIAKRRHRRNRLAARASALLRLAHDAYDVLALQRPRLPRGAGRDPRAPLARPARPELPR